MNREHKYTLSVKWTGNEGEGTTGYTAYGREYTIFGDEKPEILGSADPAFRGEQTKYNPEEFLLASLSTCHMLWYLHLCADAGIIVVGYEDKPTGIMAEKEGGGGCFKEVTLYPEITISGSFMEAKAIELHNKANKFCFIANSVNFPVWHRPVFRVM